MKGLLIIIAVVTASSCTSGVSVTNGQRTTTLEVFANVDSTAEVAIVDNQTIYVLKDGVVVARARNDQSVILLLAGLVFALWIVILIISNHKTDN